MARITFHYLPGNSFLHRWDARGKILGLMMMTLSLLSSKVPLFLFHSGLLIALLLLSRFSLKQFLRELRFWAIFLLLLFVFQILFSQGTRFTFLLWLPISKEGLILGGMTLWRLLLVLCYAILFTAVTRPREICEAVTWFVKPLPFIPERRIGLMVSLTVHFFSIILDEAEEIYLAYKARLGDQNKNPFRMAKLLTLPLIRRSFSRAGDVTVALVARGYRDDLPLHLPKLPIGHLIPLFLLGGVLFTIWIV